MLEFFRTEQPWAQRWLLLFLEFPALVAKQRVRVLISVSFRRSAHFHLLVGPSPPDFSAIGIVGQA